MCPTAHLNSIHGTCILTICSAKFPYVRMSSFCSLLLDWPLSFLLLNRLQYSSEKDQSGIKFRKSRRYTFRRTIIYPQFFYVVLWALITKVFHRSLMCYRSYRWPTRLWAKTGSVSCRYFVLELLFWYFTWELFFGILSESNWVEVFGIFYLRAIELNFALLLANYRDKLYN